MNLLPAAPFLARDATIPAGAGAAVADEIPLLRQYLRIVFRWKWVIIGSIAVCFLTGLIVTLLMTRQYTATTTIEISRETDKVLPVEGLDQKSSAASQEFYQTQYGLLRSKSLAERVADQLGLSDDPAFFAHFGKVPGIAGVSRDIRRLPAAGHEERRRQAAVILLKHVTISPTRLSQLVDISFTSPDSQLSAQIANVWAANFISSTLERRFDATAYARKFLEGRLEQLRQRLEQSERELVSYASRERIINIPGSGGGANGASAPERSLTIDMLAALNSELAVATADRIKAEARLGQQHGGVAPEALQNQAISALRERRAVLSADYQKLMVQFEPGYPQAQALKSQIDQLDRAIAKEEGRISTSLSSAYQDSLRRERELQDRVEQLKSGTLDLRRRSIQYNIYQRDVDTNRQLYDGLLQRYKEIGVAGGVGSNNISIVDPADVPVSPSSPRLLLNLFLATLAGLIIGGAAAFILEQVDEAIADPAMIERELRLPLLGAVPAVPGSVVEALSDRKSTLVEAYISVQTNLRFVTEHGVPSSLAVTSTRSGEGKSTTSLALAILLARSNKRVVLIDGDMRSPSVNELLGFRNDRGVSDYLAGEDDLAKIMHHAEAYNLDVITAGPQPPNAAELLTGDRLRKLIDLLGQSYDHVIIDSPPVVGLADSPLISSRVEGVIYAVESQGVRSSSIQVALRRLMSANAHIVGCVLTKFDAKHANFSYGYDYGYGYGQDSERSQA